MTLEEYMSRIRERLDTFERTWIASNRVEFNAYPMEMNEEEWEAQELAFRDHKNCAEE